jgi:hypothetical protein
MLSAIFQNSKSALAFAGSVIVCALMMVGTEDDAGVLDKTVNTIRQERANIAGQAAAMSMEWNAPETALETPSGLEQTEMIDDFVPVFDQMTTSHPAPGYTVGSRTLTLSDLSQEPALPPGMSPEGAPSLRNARNAQPDVGSDSDGGMATAQPPHQAVVTSRMIRIEPK